MTEIYIDVATCRTDSLSFPPLPHPLSLSFYLFPLIDDGDFIPHTRHISLRALACGAGKKKIKEKRCSGENVWHVARYSSVRMTPVVDMLCNIQAYALFQSFFLYIYKYKYLNKPKGEEEEKYNKIKKKKRTRSFSHRVCSQSIQR